MNLIQARKEHLTKQKELSTAPPEVRLEYLTRPLAVLEWSQLHVSAPKMIVARKRPIFEEKETKERINVDEEIDTSQKRLLAAADKKDFFQRMLDGGVQGRPLFTGRLPATIMRLWSGLTRRVRYEAKRNTLRGNLVWADPVRGKVLYEVLGILHQTTMLSWFEVKKTTGKEETPDGGHFPLSEFPCVHASASDDFILVLICLGRVMNNLACMLVKKMGTKEHRIKEQRLCGMDARLESKNKPWRSGKRKPEPNTIELGIYNDCLKKLPSLMMMVDLMFHSAVTRSVESTAIFLSQLVSDTAYLQLRLMVTAAEGDNEQLAVAPTHEDVETHLNSLLETVVTVAQAMPSLFSRIDSAFVNVLGWHWESPEESQSARFEMRLNRYLSESVCYTRALKSLDDEIFRCFARVKRKLVYLQSILGKGLVTYIRILKDFYQSFQVVDDATRRDYICYIYDGEHAHSQIPSTEARRLLHSTLFKVAKAWTPQSAQTQKSQCASNASYAELMELVNKPVLSDIVLEQTWHQMNYASGDVAADEAEKMVQWLLETVHIATNWHEGLQQCRSIYQCGTFSIDTKLLLFLGNQIPKTNCVLARRVAVGYGLAHGSAMAAKIDGTLQKLNKKVTGMREFVAQVYMMDNMYQVVDRYHQDKRALDKMNGVLGMLLRENSALYTQPSVASEDAEWMDLSPLSKWLRRVDDVLMKVENRMEESFTLIHDSIIPTHHEAQDQILTINHKVEAMVKEMEENLTPCHELANDYRLKGGSWGHAQPLCLSAMMRTPQLNLIKGQNNVTFVVIRGRITDFSKEIEKLEAWRHLCLEFDEIARRESLEFMVKVANVIDVLEMPLRNYTVFWSALEQCESLVGELMMQRSKWGYTGSSVCVQQFCFVDNASTINIRRTCEWWDLTALQLRGIYVSLQRHTRMQVITLH
eukprot:GEMP01002377.1.p1 GENE.GEMP01002377.1~~GEMP01002377.1.p1  ORF type:complete len:927 (+),score=179.95 GEMP01002377.1:201-2981(+)